MNKPVVCSCILMLVQIALFSQDQDKFQNLCDWQHADEVVKQMLDSAGPYEPNRSYPFGHDSVEAYSSATGTEIHTEGDIGETKSLELLTYYLDLIPPPMKYDIAMGKPLPEIRSCTYLDLKGQQGLHYFEEMLTGEESGGGVSAPVFEYRLPDIRSFEVYYVTDFWNDEYECMKIVREFREEERLKSRKMICNADGYIIFYDRQKKAATIIKAFYLYRYEEGSQLGYFFLEEDTLKLYRGSLGFFPWEDEVNSNFNLVYEFQITEDGISVRELSSEAE